MKKLTPDLEAKVIALVNFHADILAPWAGGWRSGQLNEDGTLSEDDRNFYVRKAIEMLANHCAWWQDEYDRKYSERSHLEEYSWKGLCLKGQFPGEPEDEESIKAFLREYAKTIPTSD